MKKLAFAAFGALLMIMLASCSPKTEKTVFVLRYFYLAPIDEIAGKLHFSSGKVKSMLFRSRKKLRAALEKEGLA